MHFFVLFFSRVFLREILDLKTENDYLAVYSRDKSVEEICNCFK